MEQSIKLEKQLTNIAWVLTVVVLLLVGLMQRVKIDLPDGWDFSFLAPIHATINAITAVVLVAALYFIKKNNMKAHRNAIYLAIGLSVLFLLSYVAYHFTTPATVFGDTNGDGIADAVEKAAAGSARTFYLILLITHITLAGLIFPFILFTFIRAYTGQFEKHRKMAKWVWPIWFYVAVTGPVVYLMLLPYYH